MRPSLFVRGRRTAALRLPPSVPPLTDFPLTSGETVGVTASLIICVSAGLGVAALIRWVDPLVPLAVSLILSASVQESSKVSDNLKKTEGVLGDSLERLIVIVVNKYAAANKCAEEQTTKQEPLT